MTEVALAAATLAASVGLTYVFCVRPMRQGRCAMTSAPSSDTSAAQRSERAEIDAARARVAALRACIPVSPAESGSDAGTTGRGGSHAAIDGASGPGASSAGARTDRSG